jgi:hypothetical protein
VDLGLQEGTGTWCPGEAEVCGAEVAGLDGGQEVDMSQEARSQRAGRSGFLAHFVPHGVSRGGHTASRSFCSATARGPCIWG